jgi:hypothetical protein
MFTVFGVGNVIYLGLEISNWVHPEADCNNEYSFGWTFIFRLIFIIVQTFVLFKDYKVNKTFLLCRL